jgi:hypothetical protein
MSVNGISANSFVPFQTAPMVQPSRRQSEDQIARQMEQALQNGDLTGAEQAYQQLAAFGPNNSGPFKDASRQAEFQALGQDLQNGDLAAAQSDNSTLTASLLKHDVQVAMKDLKAGDTQGYNAAMTNLKGDYWAVYGQQPGSNFLQGLVNGNNGPSSAGAAGAGSGNSTVSTTGIGSGSTVGTTGIGSGSTVGTTGIGSLIGAGLNIQA